MFRADRLLLRLDAMREERKEEVLSIKSAIREEEEAHEGYGIEEENVVIQCIQVKIAFEYHVIVRYINIFSVYL